MSCSYAPCLPDFLRVENLSSDTPARFLNLTLHRGESEAIALALEKKSNCVLLDDKFARETADRLGLRVVGTLGLLLMAKKKGCLDAVRPVMIDMMERISFRIAPTIVNRALELIGEQPL